MENHLFSPFTLRNITLRNRIGMSPMCQYSCEACDGKVDDWHIAHYASRAAGGVGLVILEASAVEARGRISPQDLGIWTDDHVEGLARLAAAIRAQGAIPGIQLAHAGRKGGTSRSWEGGKPLPDGGWEIVAPSAVPFHDGYRTPITMTLDDIHQVQTAFVDAARRAREAGYEWLELHGAHGYLIHSFLSPLGNFRDDAYGGTLENRARFLTEITQQVRSVWGDDLPLTVRLSASDWRDDGWTIDDTVALVPLLRDAGIDLIDCSSGGIVAGVSIPATPGYQVPFAQAVKERGEMPSAAVGLITDHAHADALIREGQTDLVLIGRALLNDPYWALRAAQFLSGTGKAGALIPPQYQRGID